MTTNLPPAHRSPTVRLRVPAGVELAKDDVQEGVAALLFDDGKVYHSETRDLLGKGRREIDEVLAAHGFSPVERVEPAEETEAAKAW